MDLEISKLRPRVVQQERERLYDDVMKQRMTTNRFKDENTKLRTKLQMVEVELLKKDKVIDDLLVQQEMNMAMGAKYTSIRGTKLDSHLVINLKRKVKEQQLEVQQKLEEIEALKRNIRSTRMNENEVEIKLYIEECARLRHQLEEVIRSKDTFADPQELKIIEEKFQQKDVLIGQLHGQHAEISTLLQTKDEENRKLAELIQDMERKMKKAQSTSKSANKFKKDVRAKDLELSRLRKELLDLKHQNQTYHQQVSELQERQVQLQRQAAAPPRVSSSYSNQRDSQQQQAQNIQQASEIRRLSQKLEAAQK